MTTLDLAEALQLILMIEQRTAEGSPSWVVRLSISFRSDTSRRQTEFVEKHYQAFWDRHREEDTPSVTYGREFRQYLLKKLLEILEGEA